MWENITKAYKEVNTKHQEICKEILVKGFRTSEDEYNLIIENIESQIYENTDEIIWKASWNLTEHLIWKFKSIFERDSDGKKRDWVKIDEEKIVAIWESSLKEMDKYFEPF